MSHRALGRPFASAVVAGTAVLVLLAGPAHAEDEPDENARLALLGRVWGFVKYHHPAVAKGGIDWDAALLSSIERTKAAKSAEDFRAVLALLLDRAGALGTEGTTSPPDEDAKVTIDLSWIEKDARLRGDLSRRLVGIRDAERTGVNHYVQQTPGVGNTVTKNEKPYADAQYPDEGMRLLAVFRYWNLIEYFYPYKHLVDAPWDAVLAEFVPRARSAADIDEYHLAILELSVRINDTHARAASAPLNMHFGYYSLPVELRQIEDRTVVTRIVTDDETELRVGDVVVSIAGVPVEERRAELRKYVGASNPPSLARGINQLLTRTRDLNPEMGIERGGDTKTVDVDAVNLRAYYEHLHRSNGPAYEERDGDIGYVDLGQLQKADIAPAMQAFSKTRGIVFDMRAYPSDFVLFALLPHLSASAQPFAKFTAADLSRPGTFDFTPTVKVGGEQEGVTAFAGKVIVLCDESTISSAEYHIMALQTAPNAQVIGSQTAAADGNVSRVTLPGRIVAVYTGIGVYYPDGRETQGIGIVPDIEVRPTIAGIRAGKDEVLDRALEAVRKSR